MSKVRARLSAKTNRAKYVETSSSIELIQVFPALNFCNQTIAGYWPIGTEIDVCPLLNALASQSQTLCLPCTPPKGEALAFRSWKPGDTLINGRFGTREPASDQHIVEPDVVLVPLLAFSPKGDRLGYGGGYYDRTLSDLRAQKEIYACGVAYAGQEMSNIPTDAHDQPLDGILTPDYFKDFT